jgi:hypothetical protein
MYRTYPMNPVITSRSAQVQHHVQDAKDTVPWKRGPAKACSSTCVSGLCEGTAFRELGINLPNKLIGTSIPPLVAHFGQLSRGSLRRACIHRGTTVRLWMIGRLTQ